MIGKGGETIKNMQARSGARVQVCNSVVVLINVLFFGFSIIQVPTTAYSCEYAVLENFLFPLFFVKYFY